MSLAKTPALLTASVAAISNALSVVYLATAVADKDACMPTACVATTSSFGFVPARDSLPFQIELEKRQVWMGDLLDFAFKHGGLNQDVRVMQTSASKRTHYPSFCRRLRVASDAARSSH